MRQNMFGEQYAQPTDTAEDVYDASGAAEFTRARVETEKDPRFGFGGELENEDYERFKFDGFDTREAMAEWLESQFNIGESDIEEI